MWFRPRGLTAAPEKCCVCTETQAMFRSEEEARMSGSDQQATCGLLSLSFLSFRFSMSFCLPSAFPLSLLGVSMAFPFLRQNFSILLKCCIGGAAFANYQRCGAPFIGIFSEKWCISISLQVYTLTGRGSFAGLMDAGPRNSSPHVLMNRAETPPCSTSRFGF